jgi:hypothetical protein
MVRLFDPPSLHGWLRTRLFYMPFGLTLAFAHLLPGRHRLRPLELRLRPGPLKLRLRTLHLRLRTLHLLPFYIWRVTAALLRRAAAVAPITASSVAFPLSKGRPRDGDQNYR